jgi:hypothetical protein
MIFTLLSQIVEVAITLNAPTVCDGVRIKGGEEERGIHVLSFHEAILSISSECTSVTEQ